MDRIEGKFILVLDDYHIIRNKSTHNLIKSLLTHPSPCMQLVLIGRRDPPIPLNTLRAKGLMTEIRTQDLRFSLDETVDFLQLIAGVPVDKTVAAILEEKTEGWVTGLRLAVLSLRHRKDIDRILTRLPWENRYNMDYVIDEILSHHPPTIQEYLLKTSILSRFCAPLCEAVCRLEAGESPAPGNIDCSDFIRLIDSANLFVIPLDDHRDWFRYHHLFQSLLKRQLKKRFRNEDVLKLYKNARNWFAENGYLEEAFSHALQSGDLQDAAQFVSEYRHEMMNREHWYHLGRWIGKFPAEFIQNHPDLLLAKAWVYQRQARYSELFGILDGIEPVEPTSGKQSAKDEVLGGEIQTLISFRYFATGQAHPSESSAREALKYLPTRYYSTRGFALVIMSLALQMKGDLTGSRQVVYEALQQEEASIAVYKTMLLAALCYGSWIAADLKYLKPAADQLLNHGQKHNLPETIAVGRFFKGIYHYKRNDLDTAERFLAPVVASPAAGELVVPSIVTYCQSSFALSLTYQAMGRAKEAGDIIDAVIGYMLETDNSDLLELCQTFQAELWLRQGDLANAIAWLRNHTPKPLAPAFRFYAPHLTLPKIWIARRAADSLAEAGAYLSRANDYYSSIHNTGNLIDILALQAIQSAAQNNLQSAMKSLHKALSLAEPGGFIRPFLDSGPEMVKLLDQLVKKDPDHKLANHILAAFSKEKTETIGDRSHSTNKPQAPTFEEGIITPLTKREVEVLNILIKGASNREIAEVLNISTETIKKHLYTIYGKLQVKNRQMAVIKAKTLGII